MREPLNHLDDAGANVSGQVPQQLPVGRTHLLEFVRGGTVQALAPMAS
jgi:hypothetical protein